MRQDSIKGAVLLLLLLTALGCVALATDYRRYGFKEFQKGFENLKDSPDLYLVVDLKDVRIHIVGDRHNFSWNKAKIKRYGVVGYATAGNEIFVFGKVINGKVVVNQAVLGHELNHLLNFKNPRIASPDELDDLGA